MDEMFLGAIYPLKLTFSLFEGLKWLFFLNHDFWTLFKVDNSELTAVSRELVPTILILYCTYFQSIMNRYCVLKKADTTINQQKKTSWIYSFVSLDYKGPHSQLVIPFLHNSKNTVTLKIHCSKSEQPWWGLQECRRSREEEKELLASSFLKEKVGAWPRLETFLHKRFCIATCVYKAHWLIPPYAILIPPLGGSKKERYFIIIWDQS